MDLPPASGLSGQGLSATPGSGVEKQVSGTSSTTKKRKRRRTEETDPPPNPVQRCKRGGTKVARRSRRSDRPQESHYQSDEEVRGEELLEQNFSPAHDLPARADSAEKQCLPERAAHFVLAISLACQNVIANANSEASCSVFQLFQSLQGAPSELRLHPEDDSLQNLTLCYIRAEQCASSLDFVYMLNCIQF